jgi:hypothetical protein
MKIYDNMDNMNIICYLLNFNINFLFKWLKLFLLVGLFSFSFYQFVNPLISSPFL